MLQWMACTYHDYTQGARLESQGAQGPGALHRSGPAGACHGPDARLQQLRGHHGSGAARARLACLPRLLAARTLPHLAALLSHRRHTYYTPAQVKRANPTRTLTLTPTLSGTAHIPAGAARQAEDTAAAAGGDEGGGKSSGQLNEALTLTLTLTLILHP